MELKFTTELVNGIVGYLGTKPYIEVSHFLARIDAELKEQGNGGIVHVKAAKPANDLAQEATPESETSAVIPEVVEDAQAQAVQ